MKKSRPVNLDVATIHFPLTAIISILHRISGVIVFIAVGILLWLLELSLSSSEGFLRASEIMAYPLIKFILWGIFTALAFHLTAGLRHLLMDFSVIRETLSAGTRSAQVAMGIIVIASLLIGGLLW